MEVKSNYDEYPCKFCAKRVTRVDEICPCCIINIISSCSDLFKQDRKQLRCITIDCDGNWSGTLPFCEYCQQDVVSKMTFDTFKSAWIKGYEEGNVDSLFRCLSEFISFDISVKCM